MLMYMPALSGRLELKAIEHQIYLVRGSGIPALCCPGERGLTKRKNLLVQALLDYLGPLDALSVLWLCRDRISLTIEKCGNLWHFLYRPGACIKSDSNLVHKAYKSLQTAYI